MSNLKSRAYLLSLCYTCQKCFHCDKNCSKQGCECNKGNETPEYKKGQRRKHYSRTFQPDNLDKKPYNSWQLKELMNYNEYFGYKIDFSKEFNFSLCPKCHSKLNRLGKKNEAKIQKEPVESTTQKEPVEPTNTGDDTLPTVSNVNRTSSFKIPMEKIPIVVVETSNIDGAFSLEEPILIIDDTASTNMKSKSPILDTDISQISEESDTEFPANELKFKLILKFPDGKCYLAKWEYIMAKNFHKFKGDLEVLVQSQFDDQIIFQDDYIVSYKHEKENGLGTQLANVRDWTEFLKEYDRMVSSKKTLVIIVTKKKSNKRIQSK